MFIIVALVFIVFCWFLFTIVYFMHCAIRNIAVSNKASKINNIIGLSMIGAKAIQSFEDNTENARRCAAIYASTRRGLLRMHPWSFAKKRAQLAPVTTHPTFGYENSFPLPRDFVRVISAGVEE